MRVLSSLGRDDSFISRLATGTYTLGGMYVLYVHKYSTILDRDREMLKCSDVIDWDYVYSIAPGPGWEKKRRNKVHESTL